MSGSSKAHHVYSRCLVSLDAGVSISWAADPDGSYEHGQRHHQEEEESFRARLAGAAPGIEVLFDELEEAGHVFTAPSEDGFGDGAQRGPSGFAPICEVHLACTPELTVAQLGALAERVARLVAEVPEPSPEQEPEQRPPLVAVKPWWKFW